MKNLTTRCLPEMANHGSIKIRLGKEARASQIGTQMKGWQQLHIPLKRTPKSTIGQEIAKDTCEGIIICEPPRASAINLMQENIFTLFLQPMTQEIKRNPSYLFCFLSTFSTRSILSLLPVFYSHPYKTVLSLIF